MKSGEIDIMKN